MDQLNVFIAVQSFFFNILVVYSGMGAHDEHQKG